MSVINILEPYVANLIAAGEVVDRPGSVLKELVENSIDAGATEITIEIKDGGITLMRVTDNGCGMTREDVSLAIKRHATSKIRKAVDLDTISTLGFRGEALAAITSVSKFRIMSKTADDETGTLLTGSGEDILGINDVNCPVGTTIITEDIFFNTPARKKFLKKDSSETLYCNSIIERMCLSRSDISFKYIVDGSMKFMTPGDGDLRKSIKAIFGKDFSEKLIAVDTTEDRIGIKGYTGIPENNYSNTNYQLFFINNRFVKSKTAYAAIKQAYSSYMASERFPVCVLFIDVDPKYVDVNVHPSKLEVKFSDEKLIFNSIYYAVRSVLVKDLPRPDSRIEKDRLSGSFVPVDGISNKVERQITISEYKDYIRSGDSNFKLYSNNVRTVENNETKPAITVDRTYEKIRPDISEPVTDSTNNSVKDRWYDHLDYVETLPVPEYTIIGELFNSYIVVQTGDRALFIDKHAAHERIIFEDMKRAVAGAQKQSQILLVPYEIKLDSSGLEAVSEYLDDIERMGFECSLDGDILKITAVPSVLIEEDPVSFVESLIESIQNSNLNIGIAEKGLYEKALYQASCKAAFKAGRIYNPETIKWICDKLLSLPNIKYCPHGRPVAFEISHYEFNKRFERE